MILPAIYRRCRGVLGFDWQTDAQICECRDLCLRHRKLLVEQLTGQQVGEPMQQCVNDECFLPMDAFEPKEEEA